jgi:hypothetical protein
MLGVTVFGLIFTPVFYVVMRGLPDRLKSARIMERMRSLRRGRGDDHPTIEGGAS